MKATKLALKGAAEANGEMRGAHEEKCAALKFIRGSSAHWMKKANVYLGARMFTMAIDAEARAVALSQVADDIEFGQHRKTTEDS